MTNTYTATNNQNTVLTTKSLLIIEVISMQLFFCFLKGTCTLYRGALQHHKHWFDWAALLFQRLWNHTNKAIRIPRQKINTIGLTKAVMFLTNKELLLRCKLKVSTSRGEGTAWYMYGMAMHAACRSSHSRQSRAKDTLLISGRVLLVRSFFCIDMFRFQE